MKRRELLAAAGAAMFVAACKTTFGTAPKATPPQLEIPEPPRLGGGPPKGTKPKIGLALGGGAARGFAHIGVIKALETSEIVPDLIVGTSAGSVVGALYAAGHSAFEIQRLALQLAESDFTDWALFDRGVLKGEALEAFVNKQVNKRPIESLKRRFAAVATDLATGQPTVFTRGDVGQAVRASATVPGVFAPVVIRGREYVDGGLVSPIPVSAARKLGADIVIAVDISSRPSGKKGAGSLDLLLDTVAIMSTTLAGYELRDADIVIRPKIQDLPAANFQQRHTAIMEGEKAGFAAIPAIRERVANWGKTSS